MESREYLQRVLDDVEGLNRAWAPDDPMVKRVEQAIRDLWDGASPHEWETIAARFRVAFGLPIEAAKQAAQQNGRVEFDLLFSQTTWFGRFLEWTQPGKSTPQFYFGAAVAAIAAGMGRRPLIDWGAIRLYPNLFVLLVGGTGAGKGSAIGKALEIVGDGMAPHVLANEGTPQGFAEALRRRYEDTGLDADGLIIAPEVRVLLSKDANKQDLVTWLTDWYDAPPHWSRALRGVEDEYVIRNVTVSLLGASNMVWLRLTPQDAILGGFFPRHLILDTPENEERWGTAMPQFNQALANELTTHLTRISTWTPENIFFTREALDWLDKWYAYDLRHEHQTAHDEQVRAWLNRKQACLMKLACIFQMLDGERKDAIELPALEQARRVVDWSDTAVHNVYAGLGMTQDGEIMQTVLRVIERRGGSAPERVVKRALKNRLSATKVEQTIKGLASMGELTLTTSPTQGKIWNMVKHDG